MKKLIILLLFISAKCFSQSVNVPQVSFGTRADMRLQKGMPNTQVLLNGLVTIGDGNGGLYMFNESNTDADDGFLTLQVTGVTTGRWKRISNGNTFKGSSTLSGVALQTAYTVSFGQTFPFTPLTIVVNPRSANAAVPSWISNITTTGFTINFASIPVVGTNNIAIDWIVIKN
jgi:hypothetical protein